MTRGKGTTDTFENDDEPQNYYVKWNKLNTRDDILVNSFIITSTENRLVVAREWREDWQQRAKRDLSGSDKNIYTCLWYGFMTVHICWNSWNYTLKIGEFIVHKW